MKLLFILSLATILYTYAGYPAAIALLARIRPRPWQRRAWLSNTEPPLSIIMAVHNGAAMLPTQLDHLLTLDPHRVKELIVVSDGSTDSTAAILAAHKDARLKPIIRPQHTGKSSALNAALADAAAEIILFVDIRPRIQPGALESLLANFWDPRVGCVAGDLALSTATHAATAAAVSGLYWRYEQYIRNCEALVDSPVGVYGGFYAIRRALATPYPDGLILDDMFQPLSIIRQGYRSVLDPEAHVVDTWPATSAGEYSRKVRTLAGNFQLIQKAPWLLSPANRVLFQLISHKLLRLVVPWGFIALLLTSAVLGLHSTIYSLFAFLQIAFWLMAFAALHRRIPVLDRIATPASALLVLNAAAIAALYTFLFTRSPLWKIWSPTPTSTP